MYICVFICTLCYYLYSYSESFPKHLFRTLSMKLSDTAFARQVLIIGTCERSSRASSAALLRARRWHRNMNDMNELNKLSDVKGMNYECIQELRL